MGTRATRVYSKTPGAGRKVEGEVLPVPVEAVPRLWKDIAHIIRWPRRGAPHYDLERLHGRLLLGIDQAWLGVYKRSPRDSPYAGVIVTSITAKPPTPSKYYRTSDPAAARSLTVHLVSGRSIESWIDSAVERISGYARENGCRKVFVLARCDWRVYAQRFRSHFDQMGFSVDRPTGRPGKPKLKTKIGYFRLVA